MPEQLKKKGTGVKYLRFPVNSINKFTGYLIINPTWLLAFFDWIGGRMK